MSKLHFIPRPLPDESPLSLIRRAAILNGYSTPDQFLRAQTDNLKQTSSPMRQESKICKLFCDQAEEFFSEIKSTFYEATYPLLLRPSLTINKIIVNSSFIRHKEAAICTACLKEGWERIIKDFKLAEFCPYHLRKYLNECPHCHRKLTWHNQASTTCTCGKNLESPACTKDDVLLEERFLELLLSQSQKDFNLFHSTLNSLSTGEPTPPKSLDRTKIFAALAIAQGRIREVPILLLQLFNFRSSININFVLSKLSPLTPTTIVNYIELELRSLPETLLSSEEIPSPLSSLQARRYLKASNKVWLSILRDPRFPPKSKAAYYSEKDVRTIEKIKKEIESNRNHINESVSTPDETMTYREAEKFLNISSGVLRELIQAGLLGQPIKPRSASFRLNTKHIQEFNNRYITIQALHQLFNVRVHTIRKTLSSHPIETAALPHNNLYATVYLRSDIETIRKILFGKKQKNTIPPPIKSQKIPNSQRRDYLSTLEFSNLTEIPINVIVQLIRCGEIPSYRTALRSKILIPKNKIDTIKNKYISCSEATRLCMTPRNCTTAILSKHGVLPIGGLNEGNGKLNIFHRSEFTSKLIQRINFPSDTFAKAQKTGNIIKPHEATKLTKLSKSSLSKIKKKIISPTRPSYYRDRPELAKAEVQKIIRHLRHYIPTSEISVNCGFSSKEIHRLFLTRERKEEIQIAGIPHISKGSADRIAAFAEKYLTCKQADKVLNAPAGHTRNLIDRGKLRKATPPKCFCSRTTLVYKKDIEAVISSFIT